MRTLRLLGLITALAALGVTDIQAQGNSGRGQREQRDRPGSGGVDVDVDVVFGNGQLSLIRGWFGDSANLRGLPPGLAKRDSLPPGLQRQLQKNGTLPPGLQDRLYPFPVELERQLPPLKPGLSRVIIGGTIMLLDDSSSLILDVAAIF